MVTLTRKQARKLKEKIGLSDEQEQKIVDMFCIPSYYIDGKVHYKCYNYYGDVESEGTISKKYYEQLRDDYIKGKRGRIGGDTHFEALKFSFNRDKIEKIVCMYNGFGGQFSDNSDDNKYHDGDIMPTDSETSDRETSDSET